MTAVQRFRVLQYCAPRRTWDADPYFNLGYDTLQWYQRAWTTAL